MNLSVQNLQSRIRRVTSNNPFVHHVTLLAGGTALSQALVLLASPILARLYSPDEFGALAVYVAIFSVLVVVASLRYELAIVLPEDDASAANLVVLCLLLVCGASLLCLSGVWLLGDPLLQMVGARMVRPYLWFLPVALLGAGGFQALNYWATRKQRFSVLSSIQLMRSLGQVGIQLCGGVAGFGLSGLIFGHALSQFAGLVALVRRVTVPGRAVAVNKVAEVARTYRQFPLFSAWGSLVNVFGTQVPSLLVVGFFGTGVAGHLSLTQRVLALPSALIGQAVGQVFYASAGATRSDLLAVRRLVERVATALMTVAFVVFSWIALHAPVLFTLVFGPAWSEAGRYAQYLVPWYIMSFVSSPLSSFVLVKGKHKQAFWVTLYEASLRMTAVWVGARYASQDLAVQLFGVAGAVICLAYVGWVLRLAGSSLLGWLWSLRTLLAVGFPMWAGLLVLTRVLGPLVALPVSAASLGILGLWFWLKTVKTAAEA